MVSTPFFEAIIALSQLKKRKRSGWIRHGVKNPESVAEHSWRAGIMAYILAPKGYNKDKMLRMGILHDITEIFGEDYTPGDGISAKEKLKREKKSVQKFLKLLPSSTQKEWYALWEEFEFNKSKEAKFVKEIEVLEMLFQAYEYEKEKNFKEDLTEFLEYERNNRKLLSHPVIKDYFNEIDSRWPKKAKKTFNPKKYKYFY